MELSRCFLLLALLLAVCAFGADGHHKCSHHSKPSHLCSRHHHGHAKHYVRPKRDTLGSNAGVQSGAEIGFLSLGFKKHPKLKMVKHIFGLYSKKGAPKKFDEGIEIVVNLSRGLSVTLNNFVPGLGALFQKMIIGSARFIFCVLGSPWNGGSFIDLITHKRCKAPAICTKDFGKKWGWKRYTKGYSSYDEIDQFYELSHMKEHILKLIEVDAGIKICSLKGTKKLIVDSIINISIMIKRKPNLWVRDDFILLCRYVITIVAAYGKGYKDGTGIAIVEELIEYLNIALKKANFDDNLSSYETKIKEELKACDSGTFNGSIFDEDDGEDDDDGHKGNNSHDNDKKKDDNNNSNNNNSGKINKRAKTVTTINTVASANASGSASGSGSGSSKDSSGSDGSSTSNSSSDSKSSADASANAMTTTTITTEEYDVWYDENGNVINSTRTDVN